MSDEKITLDRSRSTDFGFTWALPNTTKNYTQRVMSAYFRSASLILFVVSLLFSQISIAQAGTLQFEFAVKKKILILSDTGGGGHVAASQAIQKALGDDYEIEQYLMIENLPGHHKFNEYMSKSSLYRLWFLNRMQRFAEFFIKLSTIKDHYVAKLKTFQPNIVVSVFPVSNQMAYQEAHRLGIPFLVLSNNFDSEHFLNDIQNPGSDFKFGLALDEEDLKLPLSRRLNPENFVVTGSPLREEFTKTQEELDQPIQEIRQELAYSESDQAVVIMMGAQGMADAVLGYVEKIVDASEPVSTKNLHVIAICGNNKVLKDQVDEISLALKKQGRTDVQVHALSRKSGLYIAALMKIANALVTKPGGSSVNEGIASGIYALYHPKANFALHWERGNMRYAQSKGWGEKIRPHSFIEQLKNALNKEHFNYDSAGKYFKQNLERVIEDMTKAS